LEANNGELRFGDEIADGSPLVIPTGNPFLGVGFGTGGGGMEVSGERFLEIVLDRWEGVRSDGRDLGGLPASDVETEESLMRSESWAEVLDRETRCLDR
jgi:hypothetical protein